jgi:hypothetical protein
MYSPKRSCRGLCTVWSSGNCATFSSNFGTAQLSSSASNLTRRSSFTPALHPHCSCVNYRIVTWRSPAQMEITSIVANDAPQTRAASALGDAGWAAPPAALAKAIMFPYERSRLASNRVGNFSLYFLQMPSKAARKAPSLSRAEDLSQPSSRSCDCLPSSKPSHVVPGPPDMKQNGDKTKVKHETYSTVKE